MLSKDKKPPPEREETDQSLRVERQKTNEELAKAQMSVEVDLDAAVQKTRVRADQVLDTSRLRADERSEQAGTLPDQREVVEEERVREDVTIQRERDIADEKLLDEREQRTLLFASLLRVERGDTDQRLLMERARADKALTTRDDFMSMVSHDLRNMLGGIAVSAAMLVRTATEDEAGRRVLKIAENIKSSTVRVNRLIGDLVDITSIEAGKLAIVSQRHDVIRLIQEAVEAFQHVASAKGISLDSEMPEDSLFAEFDHDRILQVLGNLFSNAIKFTRKGGKISVRVNPADGWLRFSVKDTGMGIMGDHLDSLFERFWQVAPSDHRGLGLGLFISKCIVEAHGGRIGATSEVGVGSTFFFTLPSISKVERRASP